MKLKPLEASIYVTLPEELQKALLMSGVVPVNDIFLPNWGNQNKVNLYYGSYGSGKTVDIFDEFIKKALEDSYFRCYFGRKVKDRVRDTVFQTLIDRIEDLNLQRFFTYSSKPNSSMVVKCKLNGNYFHPFGANDTESLKGIKDPSHIFCDELDQFTFQDFNFLYSRLRTKKAFCQFYGAFNTEKVFQSHWIRKVFFDGENSSMAFKLLCNYVDNYFLNQEEYYEQLKLIANGNMNILNAIAKGSWGMVRTGGEFWKQFDESKHVKDVTIDKESTIHVSLDENVNPYVTQTIWQVSTSKKTITQVHELLCETPNNNAPKAAKEFIKWLDTTGCKDVVYVYGDPSASKRSTIDENNASFYDKYISELKKAGFTVVNRVRKSAPEIALSAAFINDIYENNNGGWFITIGSNCLKSIEDYILVKEDAEGRMHKPKTKDKETKVTYEAQGHISDSKRYFIVTILDELFNKYKTRSSKLFGYAV
jgi:PBSX family phage terminase large subunit